MMQTFKLIHRSRNWFRLAGFGIYRFNRLQNFECGAEFGVCVCDPDFSGILGWALSALGANTLSNRFVSLVS